MISACVLDASVVARFWLRGPDPGATAAALSFYQAMVHARLEVHVPDLLYAEVGNVFWKALQHADWLPVAAQQAVHDLLDLRLIAHTTEALLVRAMELATDYRISVYDAVYVSLAERLKMPLYTADRKLVRALAAFIPCVRPLQTM